MADQIVIELIGDPSGLKPAEEALKELSKVSEENMEAFNKANLAAAKFAAGAASAAKAAKTLEEAIKESSKAMAQLNGSAEKGGAALKELGKKAEESADALGKANKPIEEFNELTKEMGERAIETGHDILSMSEAAEKSVTNISHLNGIIAEGVVKAATKEYHEHTLTLISLGQVSAALGLKVNENALTLGKLKDVVKETSKNFMMAVVTATVLGEGINRTGLVATLAGLSFNSLKDSLTNGLVTAAKGAVAGVKGIYNAINNLPETTKKVGKAFMDFGKGIAHSIKEAAEGSHKFQAMHIILTAHDKTLLGVVGHTKELGNAMGEMAEAVGKATGNDKLGAEVKEKLAKAMQILTIAQTGLTVAQEAATIAAIALDAAMWPITLALAAIVAVGAGIMKLAGWFGSADDAAKNNTKTLEGQVKAYDELAESANNYVKQLEAEGATEEEIMKAKQKANQADQDALREKIALQMDTIKNETDESKKLEEQNKLKEMQTQLYDKTIESTKLEAENQKQITDGMREQGKTYQQIIEQKEKELGINNKNLDQQKEEIQEKIKTLNATREILLLDGQDTSAIDNQIKGLEKKVVVINEIKDLTQKAAEESKKSNDDAKTAYAEQLSNAKTLADAKLANTKAGSKEELDARIKDLNVAAAVEINNAKGNADLIKEIKKKRDADVAEASKTFYDKQTEAQLTADKKSLEVRLLLNKEDKKETLKLSIELAAKEKEIALSAANLTANEKLLIEKQYNDKVESLRKTSEQKDVMANLAMNKEELNADIEKEQAKLDAAAAFSKQAIEAKKKILADQKQMAIDEANATITNEKDRTKKLLDIEKQFAKEEKKIDDEVTKHNEDNAKEEAKKKEDLDKKMASEAISIGKQVADAIFAAQAEKRQQALDETINKLEAQKQHELSNHHLTAAQKAAIEKKYHEQEAAAKLKAWKADQKAKAEQAIINGILAFAAALATDPVAGYINGAIALATAGVQAGIILAKSPPKFAKGVISLSGPGTETSDSIPAYLSRGESVITAERTRQYKPILEQIHAGVYEPLPIPMLSTLPRLADVSRYLSHASAPGGIDYEKLGQAVAKALPKSKMQQLSFDKKGFSHYLISETGKVESYNNRYKE